jgi:hypothetical protein
VSALAALLSCLAFERASAAFLPRRDVVLKSAISVDPTANTVVLPLHQGSVAGKTVWYIITDSSNQDDAAKRGVLYAPLLANVGVVQDVKAKGNVLEFAGAPDFSAPRLFKAGKTGFPPAEAKPGAVASDAYSPFIRINGGSTILNAPIIATGNAPFDVMKHTDTEARVLAIDTKKKTVTLLLVHGFSAGHEVVYISTEASDPGVAAVERATYVPSLAKAGGKIPIIVFANGQTGSDNPQAQGLQHAALDVHLDEDATLNNASTLFASRNILTVFPAGDEASAYSPLWDVNLAVWSQKAVAAKKNLLETSQQDVYKLVASKTITGPDGKPFGPVGFVVNCPVMASLP